MAQHVQVRYTDDIDGTDLGETANTISFAFEGKEYSIDLSDDNAQALREAVAPYIEAGHRVTGRNTKAARKTSAKTSSADTKAIREWAQANGYNVSNRGRIPPTSWTPTPPRTNLHAQTWSERSRCVATASRRTTPRRQAHPLRSARR